MENHGRLTTCRFGLDGTAKAYQSNLKWKNCSAFATNAKSIEQVGMERFIEECKKAIMRYHEMWLDADSTLGVAINQDKAYWTYKDEYIEREWQILKRAWDQGLLEEGHYVVAYCPGCQTSLSSAEVGYEGSYKEVEDPSMYFKFKVTGTQNEYFLVWTTMPFTVITDTMLAVQPKAEYVKVKVGDETWIMVRQRVEPVMAELDIKNYQITRNHHWAEASKAKPTITH